MSQQTVFITVLIVFAVAGAGAWLYFSDGLPGGGTAEQEVEQTNIVARVNGEDIERSELSEAVSDIAARQGVSDLASLSAEERSTIEEQALEQLISRTLLRQAAAGASVQAQEAAVSAQLESIRGQFESDAEYQEALSQEGLTETELRSQIAEDTALQAYVEQAIDLGSITVTDEEIEEQYAAFAEAQEDAPALSVVRDQIESLILQQKQQEAISAHIDELRADADIEILN